MPSPVDISWTDGGADINYTPASMNFNWNPPESNVQFVPGQITMTITQYPKLEIEYLGKPIYVPPSADPDYQASA